MLYQKIKSAKIMCQISKSQSFTEIYTWFKQVAKNMKMMFLNFYFHI
jgi:hypothetical protein